MSRFRCIFSLPLVGVLLLGLSACFSGGCSEDYRVGLVMLPSNQATVRVLGKKPHVIIENDGPGAVSVDFGAGPRTMNPNSATGQTVTGPATITFRTGPDRGADVIVKATNATGMAIDQIPSPHE